MAKRKKLSSILKELDNVARQADKVSRDLTDEGLPYWVKLAWCKLREGASQVMTAERADDPYEILGLDPNCIPSDIIYKYRQLARKYHPDNLETGNEAIFKKITAAYEELCRQRGIR